LPQNILNYAGEWFPESISHWHYGGFNMKDFLPDLMQDALETAPACHFWNGGIKIDEKCQTNIVGLFAAGEGTGGIHGANRVSGNALTMTQVWGPIAGKEAADFASNNKQRDIPEEMVKELSERYTSSLQEKSGVSPIDLRNQIRSLAWNKVGVVRNGDSLKEALVEVEKLKESVKKQATKNKGKIYNKEWIEALQNENLVSCLEMVAQSSLMREESRGALYRTDFPKTDGEKWIKNVIIKQKNGKIDVTTEPVRITSMSAPKKIRKYGTKE
jgi:succinate dehydrogenase/fumarate reductase flavoprotein subunit